MSERASAVCARVHECAAATAAAACCCSPNDRHAMRCGTVNVTLQALAGTACASGKLYVATTHARCLHALRLCGMHGADWRTEYVCATGGRWGGDAVSDGRCCGCCECCECCECCKCCECCECCECRACSRAAAGNFVLVPLAVRRHVSARSVVVGSLLFQVRAPAVLALFSCCHCWDFV